MSKVFSLLFLTAISSASFAANSRQITCQIRGNNIYASETASPVFNPGDLDPYTGGISNTGY